MTKQELVAKMQQAEAFVPGKKVKLDFGDQGIVMLDGTSGTVSEDDGDADTTIKVGWDDWQQLAAGQMDGMNRVRQHQAVYAALKGKMGTELHALQLETLVPSGDHQ